MGVGKSVDVSAVDLACELEILELLLEELEDQLQIGKEPESDRDQKTNFQAEVKKAVDHVWLLLDLEQIF